MDRFWEIYQSQLWQAITQVLVELYASSFFSSIAARVVNQKITMRALRLHGEHDFQYGFGAKLKTRNFFFDHSLCCRNISRSRAVLICFIQMIIMTRSYYPVTHLLWVMAIELGMDQLGGEKFVHFRGRGRRSGASWKSNAITRPFFDWN